MEPDTNLKKESKTPEGLTDRSDGWLLRQWKTGNESAAEVLFDRYSMRLVALVASRLNRRYQSKIDPSEIVQSALGSFFEAAKHSRIQVSENVSLWRLLATFARRKMARVIERLAASKRGGDREQIAFDDIDPPSKSHEIADGETDEFLKHLREQLSDDLYAVVEQTLCQQTQTEIAESLGVDERTVRRRLNRIRERLSVESVKADRTVASTTHSSNLPLVKYNEFVLGKLIGSGGFGKVYRARMQSDGQIVAIKFLRKAFWKDQAARESFVREISIASDIEHPGIIRYLGFGESPHGGPYILSKWIDGRSLETVDSPSENQFATWLQQICDAVETIHAAGLVHGDLTPSNILIDSHDRAIVTDFGFSQTSQENRSAVLGGTLGFAAPEQLDSSFGTIGPKTDIYAIGGLIHWFAFEQPPIAAPNMADALLKTVSNFRFKKSAARPANVSLQKIMERTLRSSPADRTLTIGEIADILEKLAEDSQK